MTYILYVFLAFTVLLPAFFLFIILKDIYIEHIKQGNITPKSVAAIDRTDMKSFKISRNDKNIPILVRETIFAIASLILFISIIIFPATWVLRKLGVKLPRIEVKRT